MLVGINIEKGLKYFTSLAITIFIVLAFFMITLYSFYKPMLMSWFTYWNWRGFN